MPYLTSVLMAAAGAVVLLVVLVRLGVAVRRLSEMAQLCRGHFTSRTTVLAARIASLRVALRERGHRSMGSSRSSSAA